MTPLPQAMGYGLNDKENHFLCVLSGNHPESLLNEFLNKYRSMRYKIAKNLFNSNGVKSFNWCYLCADK
jgi:hypothetical protein